VRRGGRDADRLRIETGQLRGRNTLRVVYPSGDIVYGGGRDDRGRGWVSSWNTEMNLNDDGTWGGPNGRWNDGRRITVSNVRGGTCAIDTGSGSVRGDRIECEDVNVNTGSGTVQLDDVRSAQTSVETGSGGIRINLLSPPRNLRVHAGSGSVVVGLPANTGADVDIETGSGGIETEFGLQIDRYERNGLRGRIGNGSGRIRIETGSGSVRLLKRS